MRQLQLWSESGDLGDTFGDIEELAASCRFRDCTHQGEPGCAIHRAIGEGTLDAGRLDGYLKLQKELAYLARRQDVRAQMEERAKWKKIAQFARQIKKERGR
jgi:ribosome biogenesis GTPase